MTPASRANRQEAARQPSGGVEAAALLRRSRSWLCRAATCDSYLPVVITGAAESLRDRCDTDPAQTWGQTILPTLGARARKRIHRLSVRPDAT